MMVIAVSVAAVTLAAGMIAGFLIGVGVAAHHLSAQIAGSGARPVAVRRFARRSASL